MRDRADPFADLDVDELTIHCQEASSRTDESLYASDPCRELFRRAIVEDDQQAWAALYDQYRALTIHAGRGSRLDPLEQDGLVNETFARFADWVQSPSFKQPFPPIAVLISVLKKCASSTSIDHHRRWEHQQQLETEIQHVPKAPGSPRDRMLDAVFDRQRIAFLISRLQDDEERQIFTLSWELGFKPQEIVDQYADAFPTVHVVYRIKERIVRRLSEDPMVQSWKR